MAYLGALGRHLGPKLLQLGPQEASRWSLEGVCLDVFGASGKSKNLEKPEVFQRFLLFGVSRPRSQKAAEKRSKMHAS